MMGRSSPTPEEMKTVTTVNGMAKDVDIFVCVKSVDHAPAVFSLGQLCETTGCSHSWKAGEQPSLIKHGVTFKCRSEHHVRLVAVTRHINATPANRRRLLATLAKTAQERLKSKTHFPV